MKDPSSIQDQKIEFKFDCCELVVKKVFDGLTVGCSYGESYRVAALLDEFDHKFVIHVEDAHAIHGQNAIAYMQTSASLRRTVLDDSTLKNKE